MTTITLDTESQECARKLIAYKHQGPEYLRGLVHDALLTGSLSRGVDAEVRAEALAKVTRDGVTVDLDLAAPFGQDARIVAAGARVADLAKAWRLPVDDVLLAAIRVGLRRLLPPPEVLAAGGVS